MSRTLIIDRQKSSLANRLIQSANQRIPVDAPDFSLGDNVPLRIVLASNGVVDTDSGRADIDVKIAIGDCEAPTSGQSTLTVDGTDNLTLLFSTTAAQLETALEGVTAIGAGNVLVSGVAGKFFRIEYVGSLANTSVGLPLTTSANTYLPRAIVTPLQVQVGGGGKNEIWTIQINTLPLAFVEGLLPFTDGTLIGWEGTLSIAQPEIYEGIAQSENNRITSTLEIELSGAIGPETVVHQPVSVFCEVITSGVTAGPLVPQFTTKEEIVTEVLAQIQFQPGLWVGGRNIGYWRGPLNDIADGRDAVHLRFQMGQIPDLSGGNRRFCWYHSGQNATELNQGSWGLTLDPTGLSAYVRDSAGTAGQRQRPFADIVAGRVYDLLIIPDKAGNNYPTIYVNGELASYGSEITGGNATGAVWSGMKLSGGRWWFGASSSGLTISTEQVKLIIPPRIIVGGSEMSTAERETTALVGIPSRYNRPGSGQLLTANQSGFENGSEIWGTQTNEGDGTLTRSNSTDFARTGTRSLKVELTGRTGTGHAFVAITQVITDRTAIYDIEGYIYIPSGQSGSAGNIDNWLPAPLLPGWITAFTDNYISSGDTSANDPLAFDEWVRVGVSGVVRGAGSGGLVALRWAPTAGDWVMYIDDVTVTRRGVLSDVHLTAGAFHPDLSGLKNHSSSIYSESYRLPAPRYIEQVVTATGYLVIDAALFEPDRRIASISVINTSGATRTVSIGDTAAAPATISASNTYANGTDTLATLLKRTTADGRIHITTDGTITIYVEVI
jgi:hypothetical protein